MAALPEDMYRPESAPQSGRAILMVTDNDTEDLEFFYPYYRFIEAGFKVDVATIEGLGFKAKHELGLKKTMKISDAKAESYELLYVPGGKAPAALKKDENAVAIVKRFAELGKPIAAICHGPQLLAKADVIRGKKIAAWPECEDEVVQASASFVNQESVTDGLFVTGRWPGDLPAQVKATLALLDKQSSAATKKAA